MTVARIRLDRHLGSVRTDRRGQRNDLHHARALIEHHLRRHDDDWTCEASFSSPRLAQICELDVTATAHHHHVVDRRGLAAESRRKGHVETRVGEVEAVAGPCHDRRDVEAVADDRVDDRSRREARMQFDDGDLVEEVLSGSNRDERSRSNGPGSRNGCRGR
jgi:hypothetical protein